jgi:hypothetical protein
LNIKRVSIHPDRMRGAIRVADLTEHIRQLLNNHGSGSPDNAAQAGYGCGSAALAHDSRLAQRIVDCLGLRAETVGSEIRYVSAWFDNELTKLDGAE